MITHKDENDCSDYVILVPLVYNELESSTTITAYDENSGTSLTCMVNVGLINKLEVNIGQSNLFINVEKSLRVTAYNEKGNIFTSLNGFRFDWTVSNGTEFVKLTEKPEN